MNRYMRERHRTNLVRYRRRKARDARICEVLTCMWTKQPIPPPRRVLSRYGIITDGSTAGRGIPAMSNRSALFYVSQPMGVSTTSEIPGTQVILMP